MSKVIWFTLISSLLLFISSANAQLYKGSIKGVVSDSVTGTGINNVNVFIPFTSNGTVTDKNGHYLIKNIPEGEVDISFKHVAFIGQTKRILINRHLTSELNISLSGSVYEILEVVKIVERANWNSAYKIFKRYFLGDPFEKNCHIINPTALLFHFEDNNLLASTKEPLLIRNHLIGYDLKYYLDYFSFYYERGNINNLEGDQYYTYSGECLFTEMDEATLRVQKKRERNRESLFLGSQRHFFYALYHDCLEESGFRITRAIFKKEEVFQYNKLASKNFQVSKIHIDSVFNFLPDQNIPSYIYFQVSGSPKPIECMFSLNSEYRLFQIERPILVFYNEDGIYDKPKNVQVVLLSLADGTVYFDSTVYCSIQNGILNWRILNNSAFIKYIIPSDYFPESYKLLNPELSNTTNH